MSDLSRILLTLAFAVGVPNHALAQQAVVRRDVNLRGDASTNDPPIAKLHLDATLTLLDPTPETVTIR